MSLLIYICSAIVLINIENYVRPRSFYRCMVCVTIEQIWRQNYLWNIVHVTKSYSHEHAIIIVNKSYIHV